MNAPRILHHWENTTFRGSIPACTHRGEARNSDCGDVLTLDILAVDGIIEVARFRGDGCVLSLAGASMLCEFLLGRKLDEPMTIPQMFDLYGGPPIAARWKCCTLPLEALANVEPVEVVGE